MQKITRVFVLKLIIETYQGISIRVRRSTCHFFTPSYRFRDHTAAQSSISWMASLRTWLSTSVKLALAIARGIAIYPEGKIKPIEIIEGSAPSPRGAVVVTFERFRELARKARRMIMAGTVMPKGEEDIPKLIRLLAGHGPSSPASPR
jgi:hypothetical protein